MFHTVPAFFSPPPHPSSCFLKSNLLDLSESKAGAKAAVLERQEARPFHCSSARCSFSPAPFKVTSHGPCACFQEQHPSSFAAGQET